MNLGKSSHPAHLSTKHTRRKELKYCGRPLNVAFRTFETELNFPSLDHLWPMKHSFAEIVERMDLPGPLERLRHTLDF